MEVFGENLPVWERDLLGVKNFYDLGKIPAIKEVRSLLGWTLVKAKKMVDAAQEFGAVETTETCRHGSLTVRVRYIGPNEQREHKFDISSKEIPKS